MKGGRNDWNYYFHSIFHPGYWMLLRPTANQHNDSRAKGEA